MIELICTICGKPHLVKNYRKDISKFCSQHCRGIYQAQTVLNKTHSHLYGNKFRVGKLAINNYKKGHIPWNKNMKGVHRSPKTEFVKGCLSTKRMNVGEITIRQPRKDNSPRQWIKISEPNKWIPYAIYIWQMRYGAIPNGMVIHHINHDSMDDRIENLLCVTRKEHINIHRKDKRYFDIANERINRGKNG